MDHRTILNASPRVGSAPLPQSQSTFQRMSNRTVGSHRSFQARLGGDRPPMMQSQTRQPAPVPPSSGFFDRVLTQPAEPPASSYPENCIYDVTEFVRLQNAKDSAPKGVLALATEMWKEMPENREVRPEHILSREELFQGESMPSRVLKDRKLHNEVLGILGKVSEDNLERMKKELTDLPIRQSTDEEIQQVIQVIFNKSIDPDDHPFVPFYVKLVAHLINDIGEDEVAGRRIRNAIIRQCQRTFENAEDAQDQLEREVADLPEEDAEHRRHIFSAKQKANIYFLGLLFTHGLVREEVVLYVLRLLLYGKERKGRLPADYELVHFMELLKTCGKSFSKEGQEWVPKFRSVMEELMHTHPQRRMQFLLLNAVETIDNGWVRPYGGGASAPTQDNETERRLAPPAFSRNKVALAPPSKPIPSRDKFWSAIDKFFHTSSAEEVILILSDIPEETRCVYCASVFERYISTVRYTQQRARLGELFEELVNKRVLAVEDVRRALLQHLHDAVKQDLFADIPKYFYNWAIVIRGGRDVFPPSLHTEFLNILVDSGVSSDKIVKMVKSVYEVQNESPTSQELDAKNRFRVLPALLRHTPPLLVGYPMDEAEDIFKQLSACSTDVKYFDHLCEQEDFKSVFMFTATLGSVTHSAFSMISALFAFVRFDVEALCREYKESVKKMVNSKQLHLLLEEAYVTWLALDRTPENSFLLFVRALRSLNAAKDQLDKFKTLLTKNYGATGKKDAAMLDRVK